MDKAKEIFKEVWISHFGHSEQLDTDLNIALKHDYIFEAMQLYTDEQSREEAIKLLPWYEGTRHKHKGKTWIDIYDDGIKWIKEQEEQP